MLSVVDSAIESAAFLKLKEKFWHDGVSVRPHWIPASKLPELLSPVVVVASRLYDFDGCEGYEVWTHNGTRPDWHTDKDEALYTQTGHECYPICSIVLYMTIGELSGGEFESDGILLTPKENRLVMFDPGLAHRVREYAGARCSLAINPWRNKPETFNV